MKGRTVCKWAIGVIAIVVLIGVGIVVLLFVVGFMSLEKGEQHRRQFQAELKSGRWDFGQEPALFAVAQGIVKNDSKAIRAAAKSVPDLQAPGEKVGDQMSKWLNGNGPKMEKMLMDWNNSPSPASLRDLPRKQACVDSAKIFAAK